MNKIQATYEELKGLGINKDVLERFIMLNDHKTHMTKLDNVDRFKKVTTEMTALYARKNRDYGNSFDKSLDEDGLLVAKIRLGDKFNRFGQLLKNTAQVKDESIRDTLIDAAAYAIMAVMWLDENKDLEPVPELMVSHLD